MSLKISVYEQTCHGTVQYRVMRDDGRVIFGRIHTDFPTEEDAVCCVRGEVRRNKLGPAELFVKRMNGNHKTETIND